MAVVNSPSNSILHIVSTTNTSDLGFLALADAVAAAADLPGDDWRVIGGHMVQMLVHVYPTPACRLRGTADADAGVSPHIAASALLHERLLGRDYVDECGNRYVRDHPEGRLAIDILVPDSGRAGPTVIGGRAFDAAPGLRFALASPPLSVRGHVRLTDGSNLALDLLVPDIEAAIVLKALAWNSRRAAKDILDLAGLFEIVAFHRAKLSRWALDRPPLIGARLDTARSLAGLLPLLDADRIPRHSLIGPPARLASLIREHVARP